MTRSALILAAILGLVTQPSLARAQVSSDRVQSTGTLQGRVLALHGTRQIPLSNAIVSVSFGYRHFTVIADSDGKYSVASLSPGAWRVRAVHVGYRPMSASVQVPAEGGVTLDLSLSWQPISLPPLLVRVDPVQPLAPDESPPSAELGEVAIRALEGTSGMVEGGLAQVVQSLPGNDPSDPQDVLLMRGSTADLKLVLLDGAPVYTPFHMAGIVESFDPQALAGASLFLGGAPAMFDGGLSYILNLQGRSPGKERIRGSVAADLLTGRLFLEGPISGSTGFLVGARTIHNLGTPLLAQGTSPYEFGDLIARLEWTGKGESRAYLTGFWNQESVLLSLPDEATEAVEAGPDFGDPGLFGSRSPSDAARWGNAALAGGYSARFGKTTLELQAAVSRYEAELPLGDTLPVFAESRSDRTRFSANFRRPWGGGSLRFGLNLDRIESAYAAMALDSARVGTVTQMDLQGSSGGLYLEGSQPISPSVTIRGGGRLDRFQGDDGVRLAPRLSLTWMLTEQAALTLAGGRYHQFSNVASDQIEKNLGSDAPASPLLGTGPLELSVGTADHLVVSLDQVLTPGLRLGMEGFVKKFHGVAGTLNQSLNASGVDLRVARDGERAGGWLGYTLTWFWASDGIVTSGDSPFSGRHLLSAGFTTSLTSRTGLRIRGSYGDGLPFTSVPVFRDEAITSVGEGSGRIALAGEQVLNSAPELTVGPDQGFLRLEFEIYGQWSPKVSGRTMELRPYIRILNALDRRDALFYHFDPWRNEGPEPLADLPVLPLIGLEWRF